MIFKCRKASDSTNDQGLYEYDTVSLETIQDLYEYVEENCDESESVIIRFNHNPNEWVLDFERDEDKINELIIYDDYVE